MMRQEFRDRLRDLMRDRDWSADRLAAESGIPRRTITTYLAAPGSLPGFEVLAQLSRTFSVSCDWLVFGDQCVLKLGGRQND